MKTKKFLSFALVLTMLAGMLPGMSLTASAAGNTTEITPTNTSETMTITLTITGELSNDNVTLSADSFTYNGSTQKPTVTVKHQRGSGAEVTLTEGTDYTVAIKDSANATVTEPKTVGTYTVTVTGMGVYSGTGSKTYNITKSTPSAPAAPTKASASKNAITLTVPNDGYEYQFKCGDGSWQDSAEFTGLSPNTEYTFYQRIKATDNTNESASSTGATISTTAKDAQTITAADVSATYGDTGKSVSATTDGDGAISYAVKSGSEDYIDVNATTGALTIKKAGTATVTVTAAETATYAQATKDVTVTVNPKTMTVSAENVTVTADGQPHGITVRVTDPASGYTVKYGTTEGTYDLDASPTQTEAGTLTVYYQVTAENYTTYTGSATVTVRSKSSQTITASNVTATYGDTGVSVSATTSGNGTLSYAVKSGNAVTVNASTGALTIVKAGTAVVTVTASSTSTYTSATKDVTVTVNPKSLTIAAQDQNIMVGDTVPDLSAPVLNTHYTVTGLVGSDALTTAPTLAYSATPDNTRAGTYTITPSGANAGGNYTISYQTGTLTITAKPAATVTTAPTAKTGLTFNGVDQALVNAGAASGGTMQYALGANAAAAPTSGWGTAIPTGKEAKDYYVWYKAAGDAEHSDSDPACVTVTIGTTSLDAQGVTIYAIPDQNSTGEQIKPKPVVKHLGYLLVEGTDYELSYGANTEIGKGTGTVTITGKGGYSGTLTRTFNIVLPAYEGTLTVTAPGAYTYGDALGAAPAVTSSAGSLSGETVKVYYSATPSGEGTAWSSGEVLNAGTYYVWAELAKTAAHDAATSARVTFTVSKATPAAPAGVLAASYADTYKVTLSIPGDKTYADYEYSLDGTNWTSVPALKDGAFTPAGLSAGTAYTFSLRTKADSNHNASPAATATLKTPAKVLLSYDANGSTATVPASAEYDSGATVTAAAAITRAGYTFAGWNTAANGGGTAYAAGAAFTISANTTLYAQWTPITYSVDYHENGGNACTDETGKAYNAEITLPTPTYAEHTFNGWATVSGGSPVYRGGQKVSGLTSVNGATVDLYAVWTENTYKITGEVKEERDGTTEQSIVAGVTVKIMRGSVEFATTATDDYGKYTFSGVPAGSYNIVATRTVDGKNQTMTALVEVKSDKTVETIVLPPSGINSALDVKGDSTPPVMVGGLDDVAKDEAEENKEVTVTMTVEQKDENTATEQQKQEMQEIKEAVAADTSTGSGSTELEFLDVKVEKKTEDGSTTTTEPITETSQVVEMIVPFNTSGRFSFIVYRWHDGKAEAFQKRSSPFASGSFMDGWYYVDMAAGLFHIYGSRFSTYAIGYEEGTGYTLTVNNGTGSGEFAVGATITITADAAPSGKVFDKWTTGDGVDFADATASTTTFVMPAKNVTVTATYKDAPVTTYTATVVSGTGSGSYAAGASVTIKANPAPSGKVFDKWVSSDGVSFANANSSTTTFTMPAKNVTVTATYKTASSPTPYYPPHNPAPTTYTVQTEKAEHGTVKTSYEKTSSGTKVTITATPDAGYEVGSVTVTDANGNSVKVTKNADGTYSFTMPASKVTVKVTFVPVAQQQACPQDSTCPLSAFTDTDPKAWYHDGVHYVLEHGIMSGMGDGLFAPNGTTTRAQLATILWNMEGRRKVSGGISFNDVKSGDWYFDAVNWASAQGLILGYDDANASGKVFAPNDALTREQLVTILYRYAKLKGIDVSASASLSGYTDAASVSSWAEEAMCWAVGNGLITGKTATTLNPSDKASRAEIATITERFCEKVAK